MPARQAMWCEPVVMVTGVQARRRLPAGGTDRTSEPVTGARSGHRRKMRGRPAPKRVVGTVMACMATAPLTCGPLSATSVTAGAAAAMVTVPGARQCELLPPDDVWNTPILGLPVDPRSAGYIAAIGAADPLHPDFGRGDWDGEPLGIPYNVVSGSQTKVPVTFEYASESNPGPYPIPPGALIEGGPSSTGDRHVIVVDTANRV